MKEITTSNGYSVLVSEEDFCLLSKWSWRKDRLGYAVRSITKGKISMHQQIMGTEQGKCIDHINRNKLDNRRGNLRFVTKSQNNLNRDIDPRSKTGHNGITICKTGSYRVRVSANDLGRYKTLEEAIYVRQKAVEKIFLNGGTNQSKPMETP